MAKRRLRGQTGATHNPVAKPQCPKHRLEMFFNPSRMVWDCPDKDCNYIAHPKSEIGGSSPVSLKGPFELVRVTDEDGEETILMRQQKVFIDVTDMVVRVKGDNKGGTHLTLWFPNIVDVDENGLAR